MLVAFFYIGNEALTQTPPPPPFGWSPSPAIAGADELRHYEEQSDEAIQNGAAALDCFAALAMTTRSRGTPWRPSDANPVTFRARTGKKEKIEGWCLCFSARQAGFATPVSPRPSQIKIGSRTPTNAGTTRRTIGRGACSSGARSSVGVPPRFSPKGVVVPKAQLQARFPGTRSDA
jgi:hypothetical protein